MDPATLDDLGEVLVSVDVDVDAAWDDPLRRVENIFAAAGTAGWLAMDVHAGRRRVLVRTAGDRIEQTVLTHVPGPGPAVATTSFDDLAEHVATHLGSCPTFDVEEEGGWGAVALGRLDTGLTAHAVAYRSGLTATGAATGGWSVVALDGGRSLTRPEEPLDVVARGVGGTGRFVVLVRCGATTAAALVCAGQVVEELRWDRPWRPYRPATGPGAEELEAAVRAALPSERAAGTGLAQAVGLDPGTSRRWAELTAAPLDRPVDVRTVGRALGLPAEVADAAIDPSTLERVPGAVRADPRPRKR